MERYDRAKFITLHEPGLITNEIKYSILLDIMSMPGCIDYWSLGEAGACAVRVIDTGWSIVLGDIDETEAHKLAELTAHLDYPGVIGAGLTTHWFASRAVQLGVCFDEIEPQQIYMIDDPPIHPRVDGYARPVERRDLARFLAWLRLFRLESAPRDPVPSVEDAERLMKGHQFYFWINDRDETVSMAGICRRLTQTAAITGVYTPPEHRGRGYAGAITAAVVEHIHLEDRTAILYTDLRHPAPNRCYSRLGFRAIYPSYHFHRGGV